MHVPADVVRLMQEHPHRCWLTVLQPHEAEDFDDVARVAGIEPLEKRWSTPDRETAEAFLTALLHRSLAYNTELMPEKTAAWLAGEFLDSVGKYGARFATNSADRPGHFPYGWTPATDFTFDPGLIAIGELGSVLYWVADED